MSFVIDTGTAATERAPNFDAFEVVTDAIMDSLPEDPTQAQIDDATAQAITGILRQPKTLATVRRRFLKYWPLIEPLAWREPELFDAILLEFAELTTRLD